MCEVETGYGAVRGEEGHNQDISLVFSCKSKCMFK